MKPQDSTYNKKFRNSALVYIFPVMLLIFALHSVLDWFILKTISYICYFFGVFLNIEHQKQILPFKIIFVNAQRFFFIYMCSGVIPKVCRSFFQSILQQCFNHSQTKTELQLQQSNTKNLIISENGTFKSHPNSVLLANFKHEVKPDYFIVCF